MSADSEELRKYLQDFVPGGHQLPGSFQSPTRGEKVDPASWPPCGQCGRKHPSAVCPFCGWISGEGEAALDCIQKNGPCRQCRSCFHCDREYSGTRCPGCGMPRGWMIVGCPFCGGRQAVLMPHWGDRCDLFTLDCAHCETRFCSLCIC